MALFMGTSPEWVTLWFAVRAAWEPWPYRSTRPSAGTSSPGSWPTAGRWRWRWTRPSKSTWPRSPATSRRSRPCSYAPTARNRRPADARTPLTPHHRPAGAPGFLGPGHGFPDRSSWDRPTAIFSTSGTTGRPGRAGDPALSAGGGQPWSTSGRLQPGEVVYGPLPLFHLSAVGTRAGTDAGRRHRDPGLGFWSRHMGPGTALRGIRDRAGRGHVDHAVEPPSRRARHRTIPSAFISAAPVPKRVPTRWRSAGSAASSPVTA